MDETGSSEWLDIDTTDNEMVSACASSTARLQQTTRTRQWKLIALWVLLGGIFGWAFGDTGPFAGVNSAALGALALSIGAIQLFAFRKQLQRIAAGIPKHYRIAMRPDGLASESELGTGLLTWNALEAIERRHDAALLHYKGFRTLWVPERCFADAAAFASWLAQVEQFSAKQASAAPATPEILSERRGRVALRDLLSNLQAGLRFALFRVSATQHLRISGLQIVLVVATGLCLELAFDLANVGLDGQIYGYALPYQLFTVLCALACAWAVSNCAPQPARIPTAALAILTPMLVLRALFLGLTLLADWMDADSFAAIAGLFVLFWGALAAIVALVRSLDLPADQRMGAVLGVIFLMVAPVQLDIGRARLWNPDYSDEASARDHSDWNKAATEAVLYAQPALLDKSLNALRKGKPGVPELYLLALGGYGSQDVFKREVESVDKLFAERFGTQGHSVVLVNNPATVETQAMATTIALQRTLAEIGRKMNREEDVLFLFMTSHGAADHKFSLELWPYKFGELTPQSLRAALDEAGIRNRVIVVSACYSGGFVPPLADEHTLVMSASRADRNSHGCSHEADWTFFGKAYFDEALRETRSFTSAFETARASVAAREKEEGLMASEPQIAEGAGIRPVLEALDRALPPPTSAIKAMPESRS